MTNNADASAKLQEWIERLRSMPYELVKAAAPDVGRALKADVTATASAGQSPDGEAWAPTKAGKKALPNAAAKVSVEVVGSVILARLTGPEVRHHKGTARGGQRRQILPSRKIPSSVTRAIVVSLGNHYQRIMGGG